ncbi:hypothetical protein BMI79_09215 [Serratia oryzae]|uniref:Fimbrial-type adhesion domain-containing protein n=2 Tax=Serratia oryzae TaxID=2034155 RepID=A0A1S8CKG9_9GAMM|nr:hypothetical protein BMI79_09215 [Serratia oryzae]
MTKLLLLAAFSTITMGVGMPVTANSTVTIPDPEITFHGTVLARACDIAPESLAQSVDMGTVVIKSLYRYEHDVAKLFHINLTNCKTDVYKTATVTFTGTEDRELTGCLAVNNGANGVGICIMHEGPGAHIDLGKPSRASILSNGTNTLKFLALMVAHPSALKNRSITEGEFSSIANFVISYQ